MAFLGSVSEGDLRVMICRLHGMEGNTRPWHPSLLKAWERLHAYTIRLNYVLLCRHWMVPCSLAFSPCAFHRLFSWCSKLDWLLAMVFGSQPWRPPYGQMPTSLALSGSSLFLEKVSLCPLPSGSLGGIFMTLSSALLTEATGATGVAVTTLSWSQEMWAWDLMLLLASVSSSKNGNKKICPAYRADQ